METPSQTVGPFFGFALPRPEYREVTGPGGITLEGRVLDGAGEPVPDALVEIFQLGAPPSPRGLDGFGRSGIDPDGFYRFTTVRSGPYLAMLVFARGLLKPVATRVYFEEDLSDPLLAGLPPERRATLVARGGPRSYTFDVHLQGDGETVFLGR